MTPVSKLEIKDTGTLKKAILAILSKIEVDTQDKKLQDHLKTIYEFMEKL